MRLSTRTTRRARRRAALGASIAVASILAPVSAASAASPSSARTLPTPTAHIALTGSRHHTVTHHRTFGGGRMTVHTDRASRNAGPVVES
ncbi:MAG: hypothetical protein ACLP01_28365 [Solirubrobacteraceae bacterium]